MSYLHKAASFAMNIPPEKLLIGPLRSGLLASLLLCTPLAALDLQPESGTGWQPKQAVQAQTQMVVAAHPLASRTGLDILEQGGNAIDAAVAVQMMLNLVEPQSSGLGGGAFMLYWDARNKTLTTYDGRETAPAKADPDYFLDSQGQPMQWWQAVTGGRSVGVPGTLRLLEVVHRRHGDLAWRSLLQPAINQAREGFTVSPRLAESIAAAAQRGLADFEATRNYFFAADGSPLAAGVRLRNPEFADTLDRLIEQGPDYFYRGELARRIVETVTTHGQRPGLMSLEDLAAYQVREREPVCAAYRDYRVCGMGPPSSGALTVGQILGIAQHFDLPGLGFGADAVHIYSEAAKLAYADRARYMADSDYVPMPTEGLLNPDYLVQRAAEIDTRRSHGKAVAGAPPWEDPVSYADGLSPDRPGTSHFSIVDRQGNIVSMTTTIETGFGSRLMVGGFLLNNEMTDFSFVPENEDGLVANRVEGGKRPRSSMAPTIVFGQDGKPLLVLGSPGGSRIINYVAATIIAALDWKMDIQSAISLGHFVNRNGDIELEQDNPVAALAPALEARGHEVRVRDLNSGLHGIQLLADGGLLGGADPRREGQAVGR